MSEKLVSICAVGDLILDQPGPMETYFEEVKPELTDCSAFFGHVETPHSDRDVPYYHPSPVKHLKVLKDLGMSIATTACNHTYDAGPEGVIETVEHLHELGIQTAGSGATIYEARKMAVVEREGIKIGVVDFNASGPKLGWATSVKPGTNYVDVMTVYQSMLDMPQAPANAFSYMTPASEQKMKDLISECKKDVDILIAWYHKGNGGVRPTPGWLSDYEVPMCHAAVDAGADIVIGEHHHMLKGIEFYKGVPIYHGLGNFVTVTYAMTPGYNDTEEKLAYFKQRIKEGRGAMSYDPPYYPWTPETLYTMIAKIFVDRNGAVKCGYVPCKIDSKAVVRLKYRDRGGQEVFDFVKSLTDDVEFNTEFEWSEDGRFIWAREKK